MLKTIANGEKGFKLGKPWRYSEHSLAAILPILRDTKEKKTYKLSSEVDLEIHDTGNINMVRVKNPTKSHVFIRAGEIFKGKTQERVVIKSVIIAPGVEVKVEVRCVHASKGIRGGTKMNLGGTVTENVRSAMMASVGPVNQSEVWGEVRAASLNYAQTVGPVMNVTYGDDMVKNIEVYSESLKGILEKVPLFPSQVGISILDTAGCKTVECFDLPKSWKEVCEAIAKSEGVTLAKEDKQEDAVFEYKEEKAVEATKKVLLLDYAEETLLSDDDVRIIKLNHDKYVGEVVELKKKVIHVSIHRK